ncbi:MAG: DUF3179 domain-containing protein [Chloroflexota bacterium]
MNSKQLTRRAFLLAVAGAGLAACRATSERESESTTGTQGDTGNPTPADSAPTPTLSLASQSYYSDVRTNDDGVKHLIPLDDVEWGGVEKDGIPSIDSPRFAGPDGWDEMNYDPDRLVIGVEVGGRWRAYPLQILIWHEIVNETFNGRPLLVTYCPLCGSAIVYEREIDGQVVEFGVSGELYNSDLLMYDRETDSRWDQINGTCVIGELTGKRLTYYPSETMTWRDWQETYPDSEVLSRDTGYQREYDGEPYNSYFNSDQLWFSVANRDDRLTLKTMVTGVELGDGTFVAYVKDDVVEQSPVHNEVDGIPLLAVADPTAGDAIRVLRREVDGQVLTFEAEGDDLVDGETGSTWSYRGEAVDGDLAGAHLSDPRALNLFWFAWVAFHPDTELWNSES